VKIDVKFLRVDRSGSLTANDGNDRRFWSVSRQMTRILPDKNSRIGATSFIKGIAALEVPRNQRALLLNQVHQR
jgi:hypothetical protein